MRWIKDHGLTIALMVIFALALMGQGLTGWAYDNEQRRMHGEGAIALLAYLRDPEFLSALFENWESEFLQMAAYVILTAVLIQRGSAESRDPDETDKEAIAAAATPDALKPWPARLPKGDWRRVLYEHSLGAALGILFVISFILHWINSARAAAEEAVMHGETPLSAIAYLGDAQLWFESFQNWQSEFLSTAVLVVLSIWLRQKNSPESKAVAAPHSSTGA